MWTQAVHPFTSAISCQNTMYRSFFHLTRNPFDLSPDPACFVSTPRHDEALATLYYGVRQHKGFIVVTGEVGTGKTLLLRCLLQLLEKSHDIAFSYVFNGRLGAEDFLRYILADLGFDTKDKNKSDLLLTFTAFLTDRGAKGLTTLLIVDEAHDLSEELLEEIRLLTNIETTKDKLLQVLLIGQPELEAKLDSMGLRQLKQRIALRARLEQLSPSETMTYISQRLEMAGANLQNDPIFSPEAVEAVYRHSNGIPRLINTLCENALLSSYAMQSPTVTPEIIDQVAEEFRLDGAATRARVDFNLSRPEKSRTPLEITTLLRNADSTK